MQTTRPVSPVLERLWSNCSHNDQTIKCRLINCPKPMCRSFFQILLDILQHLVNRVRQPDAAQDITSPVASIVLALMMHVRSCFTGRDSSPEVRCGNDDAVWPRFFCYRLIVEAGYLRSLEKCGKHFGCFPVWKNNFYGLLVWKKKLIFQTRSFDMHFHNISFQIDNFTFIVLTIIVPVFDQGMSFGKV